MLLLSKLRTSNTARRQRLLTLWAGVHAVRRIREARQGAVHFEHVADGDDALRGVGALAILDFAEHVAVEAARVGMSKMQALSRGADSRHLRLGT